MNPTAVTTLSRPARPRHGHTETTRAFATLLAFLATACTSAEPITFAPFPPGTAAPWLAEQSPQPPASDVALERALHIVSEGGARADHAVDREHRPDGPSRQETEAATDPTEIITDNAPTTTTPPDDPTPTPLNQAEERPDAPAIVDPIATASTEASAPTASPPPPPTPPRNRRTINVNTAGSRELQRLPGIGPAIAEKIIEARPYSSVDDLLRVRGIGPATLARIQDQVSTE